MKKLQILFAVLVSSAMLFNSCGDGTDTVNPKPVLTFKSDAGYINADKNVKPTETIKIGVVSTSEDDLSKLEILVSKDGGAALKFLDTAIKGNSLDYDVTHILDGKVGVEVWTFTVTTKEGESATKAIRLSKSTSALEYKNQKIYHIQGKNLGAYSLVEGIAKASGDPAGEKDLIDQSVAGTFSKSLSNTNGSKYILNPAGVTYAGNNTLADIEATYKANEGSAVDKVTGLKKGDIMLVKSGQTTANPYFIIEFVDVVTTSGDNNDYYEFNYKGKIN